jgi:hypothetical protein
LPSGPIPAAFSAGSVPTRGEGSVLDIWVPIVKGLQRSYEA